MFNKKTFRALSIMVISLFVLAGCVMTKVTYTVEVLPSEHGTVVANSIKVDKGGFVRLEVRPDDNYILDELRINDSIVTITDNEYVITDIQNNITVSAKFKLDTLTVRYLSDDGSRVLFTKNINPGESAEYHGAIPTKATDSNYYYKFDGWYTSINSGTKVETFVFNSSTDLYARFKAHEYEISLITPKNKIALLETLQLEFITDLEDVVVTYNSSDEDVAKVSNSGLVTGVGAGSAVITASIGYNETSVTIEVENNGKGIIAKYVFGEGFVEYNGAVGTIRSAQANLYDLNDNLLNYKYVDYSVDFLIDQTINGNFGLQFNKTVGTNGSVVTAYQLAFVTTGQDNVVLKKNGINVVGTSSTYEFEIGKIYNVRALTEKTEGGIKITGYINGEIVFEYTDSNPVTGTLLGIRNSEFINIQFANIKVIDITPSYAITTTSTLGGTVSSDVDIVVDGKSVVITVVEEIGYKLTSLLVNGTEMINNVENSMFIIKNVMSDLSVEAVFTKVHTVNKSVNGTGGNIFVDKNNVLNGHYVTVTIVPDQGYRLKSLIVNGQTVSVSGLSYKIEDVTEALVIIAEFEVIPDENVSISFFDDEGRLIDVIIVIADELIENPPIAIKPDNGMSYFDFMYWQTIDGTPVTSLSFAESTSVYAKFKELLYTLEFENENYDITILESVEIKPITDNPKTGLVFEYDSENEALFTIVDGKVQAVGIGTSKLTVTCEGIVAVTNITVIGNTDYTITGVYGTDNGRKTINGVYTISSVQADIFDVESGLRAELKYFDIELNLYVGTSIGTGANFGFQINKTENAQNAVLAAYQISVMTTDQVASNNIIVMKSGVATSTKATMNITKGNVYRMRIVTSKFGTSGVQIDFYINDVLVLTHTETTGLTGTIFGFRCASLMDANNPHKVALLNIKNNSHE